MISDEEILKSKDVPGPTKEEIRCLVLCKARIKKNDYVVEVGCGTGAITIELAKKAGRIDAIDKNIKAINLTRKNLKKQGLLDRVNIIHGEATEVLKNLKNFDVMIVGGSGGKLQEILNIGSKKLTENGRIVITAILLETKVEAVHTLQNLGFKTEIIEVNISKGRILDRGTMMLANNPISIITGYLQ